MPGEAAAGDAAGAVDVTVPGPPALGPVLAPHPATTTGMAARISIRQRMPLRRRRLPSGCVPGCLGSCAGQLNAGMTSWANSSAERRVSANVMSPKANSREK